MGNACPSSTGPSGPQRQRSSVRRYTTPFALLCLVTSLAFNHARIVRQRTEEHRQYLIQSRLLNEELSRLLSPRGVPSSAADAAFAKRYLAAGLDPRKLGIAVSPQQQQQISEGAARAASADNRSGTSQISWSEALFGGGTLQRMVESLGRATQQARHTFGSLARSRSDALSPSAEDRRLDEEWERTFVYAASVHENAPPSEAALQVETPRVEVQSAESSAPLADGNMDYGTITHSGGKGAAPASVIAELPELGTQQQAKHAPRMKLYI